MAAPAAASSSASLPGFAPAAPVPPPAHPVPPPAAASTQLATTTDKVGSAISAAAAEASAQQPKPKSILRGSGSGGIAEKAKNKEEKVKKWVTAPANTKKIVLPPKKVAEPAAAEPKAGNTAAKPDAKPSAKPAAASTKPAPAAAPAAKSPPASASSAKESAGTPGLDSSLTPRDRHGKRIKKMAAKSALQPAKKRRYERPEASTKKKEAPKKKKTTVKRGTKKCIYSGPPHATDAMDGVDFTGWLKESFERAGGATVGRPDHYWYTPKQRFQMRSKAEIKRFCAAMLKEKDEEKAAKIATNRTTAPPRLDASKK